MECPMSSLIHAVIARDENKNILQVIACFSERQVEIAKKFIKADWPKARIEVKSTPHEEHDE